MAVSAAAHAPDQSYVFLDIYDDALHGRVEIPLVDLNRALDLSLPTDGSAELADVQDHLPAIRAYVRENAAIGVNGGAPALPLGQESLTHVGPGQYLSLPFEFNNLPGEPSMLDVRYSVMLEKNPNHRGMLVIEDNWKTATFGNEAIVSLTFAPGREQQTLDLEDSSMWRGFMALVGMGVHHIWIGIDHILFLVALLLPAVVRRGSNGWEPVASFKSSLIYVVKIVTLFTVAHTITLSLAALGTISLSSRLVESVIALSIAVAALDIIVPIFGRRIWIIVFGFGLFHGFGFASVLGDIGIPPRYMVHSLLGFNIGVELGQLAIVCALFPVLFLLRNLAFYPRVVLRLGAAALIVIAMYWFTERAFEVDLPAGAVVNTILGSDQGAP